MQTNHYGIDEWAEFSLGLGDGDHRAILQAHLDKGCGECAQTVRMWKLVREMLVQEDSFRPPESVLRYARTLYRVFPPREASSPLIRTAHLIFDSFRQPALEGVRDATLAPERLLFQSLNLMVDVMVEPQVEAQRLSLLGQIFDPTDPASRYENRPVALARGAGEIERTTTNRFGEFELTFSPGPDLLLIVHLQPQAVLVSPLPVGRYEDIQS